MRKTTEIIPKKNPRKHEKQSDIDNPWEIWPGNIYIYIYIYYIYYIYIYIIYIIYIYYIYSFPFCCKNAKNWKNGRIDKVMRIGSLSAATSNARYLQQKCTWVNNFQGWQTYNTWPYFYLISRDLTWSHWISLFMYHQSDVTYFETYVMWF